MDIAQELDLNIRSTVNLRSRGDAIITVSSGPHVHKKAREQYKIERHKMMITLDIEGEEDMSKFVRAKNLLRTFGENSAGCATYIYPECGKYSLRRISKERNAKQNEQKHSSSTTKLFDLEQ